jgi:hypothetical protein
MGFFSSGDLGWALLSSEQVAAELIESLVDSSVGNVAAGSFVSGVPLACVWMSLTKSALANMIAPDAVVAQFSALILALGSNEMTIDRYGILRW